MYGICTLHGNNGSTLFPHEWSRLARMWWMKPSEFRQYWNLFLSFPLWRRSTHSRFVHFGAPSRLIKPASSPALLTWMSSGRFSNHLLWLGNKSPCTGTLVEGGFVKIDTSVGEIRDSEPSLRSSHTSDISPETLSWLTELVMRNH